MSEPYAITLDRPGMHNEIEVDATLIVKTDAEINSALPIAKPGTIIYTADMTKMKRMKLDRTWASLLE